MPPTNRPKPKKQRPTANRELVLLRLVWGVSAALERVQKQLRAVKRQYHAEAVRRRGR